MKKIILLLVASMFAVMNAFSQVEKTGEKIDRSKWDLIYNPNYTLKFFGRISFDGACFAGDNYQPLGNGTTISQLAVGGVFSFGERLTAKFEVDMSNGHVLLLDNYITYNFTKEFGLRAGNVQEAFSMDVLSALKDLAFMNRSLAVDAFGPGYHLGLQGVFENSRWLLTGGMHFQRSMIIGQKESSDVHYKKGQNEGVSYTARMVWMPQDKPAHKGLHLGVGASYRTPKTDIGKDTEPNTVRHAASESRINRVRFMDTGYINEVDHSWLGGIELAGYYGPFKVQAEHMHNHIKRKHGLATEKFSGFYAQTSCLLFGGKQDYNNTRGAFNQPLLGRKGDLELAARFDYLDLNGSNIRGGKSNQYTFGVNYYMNENVKLQFNYSNITYDKFADANGTLAVHVPDANGGVKKADENNYSSFNIRVQLRF